MKLGKIKALFSKSDLVEPLIKRESPQETYDFKLAAPLGYKCLAMLREVDGDVIWMQLYVGFNGSSSELANAWNARNSFVKAYCYNGKTDVSLEMDVLLKGVEADIVIKDAISIWVSRIGAVGSELFPE